MPRIRGRRQKKKRTTSRVGGLGSKAKSRSIRQSSGRSTPKPMQRQRFRIRRPISRSRRRRTYSGGMGYHRRYRRRPMSSCGCFTFFIILAIIWLIFLAPSIVISLDATLAFVIPIAVVLGLFIIALWFITKIVDDDDDNGGQTTIIERERVLVICPYCGTKNEQGITTCANCGGDI
ncbi:MAG: zinc ribbon domain-containing protein [Candidatus Thorarchaeota archaeon]|nr:zinc ribbon domain-containing protein [Candidatus Thorarchaeota archaeon]